MEHGAEPRQEAAALRPASGGPAKIHPTAIIDPAARIGAGVEIGPYCIVGADVEIGDGCWLQHHVTVLGPTKMGKRNRFHAYASIGQQSQDLKYTAEPTYLEIGDENNFREFCTVNRATSPGDKTIIGSHNHFLAYCHIAHDCVVGSHCIFSNNGTLAGHVIVEDHVIMGGLTAVHQFCRLGAYSILGGCTKIEQDVPPFTTVDGNPGRARGLNHVGLRRAKFPEDGVQAIEEAFKTIYRRGLNRSQALAAIRQSAMTPEVDAMARFIETSKRGIVSGGKEG
jgi:UDP-N-acetylglucosamine acyltransferase